MRYLLYILLIPFAGLSQTDDNLHFYGTVQYEDDLYISQKEVSMADWFSYVYDINIDNDEDVVMYYFPNTPNENNKFLLELFLRSWNDDGDKEIVYKKSFISFPIWITKDEKKEKKNIFNYLETPITGLSSEKVNGYLQWLEVQMRKAYLKDNDTYDISIILPSLSLMEELKNGALRGNTTDEKIKSQVVGDSVNVQGCQLFNFKSIEVCKGSEEKIKLYGSNNTLVDSYAYYPDLNGLYNILGNVAEMTDQEGVAYGGTYDDFASKCINNPKMTYDKTHSLVGFRYVIKVMKK